MRIGGKLRLTLLILFSVTLLVYLLIAGFLYFNQSRFVFFPIRDVGATPETVGLKFTDVEIITEDGLRLGAWFVPAESSATVVLFCHGNGGNISTLMEYIKQFHRLGHAILVFDYRGYGTSEGEPDEEGMYKDARAAWNHLITDQRYSPDRIIVVGLSLGGPVAAQLAVTNSPRAVILQSTFTSLADMASNVYPIFPVRYMLSYRYPTVEFVQRLRCPLLIIHSTTDEVIPFEHGQALYDAAHEPKEFLQISGGHNDGHIISATLYHKGIAEFLSRFAR